MSKVMIDKLTERGIAERGIPGGPIRNHDLSRRAASVRRLGGHACAGIVQDMSHDGRQCPAGRVSLRGRFGW
jgi:hypothetical protein